MIITIDGPAGSWKWTTAKLLAKKINFHYLDSGAMYRAVAVYLSEQWISWNWLKENHLDTIALTFDDENYVCINGIAYESKIRTPEAGIWASQIASQPIARDFIISIGKTIISQNDYVLEWRDTGTIWAPNAELKFYLTADPFVRAHRRFLDLKNQGENITETEVLKQIIARDFRDMSRKDGPLVRPEWAHEIDTTQLTIAKQVERLYLIYTTLRENK